MNEFLNLQKAKTELENEKCKLERSIEKLDEQLRITSERIEDESDKLFAKMILGEVWYNVFEPWEVGTYQMTVKALNKYNVKYTTSEIKTSDGTGYQLNVYWSSFQT